jgi:ubiquinone/menaquinone biosynthesis C-methylase UbiE
MRFLPALPRSQEPELLDRSDHDYAALADNLADLRALDRYLGGSALTWRALWPLLRELPRTRPISLLDVATGGADGPRSLAARARRRGYDLRPLASDRLADVLRLARAAGARFPLIQHDALAIPLPDRAVDFVTCSLALHHFEPLAAIALLRELRRVARRAVIVNDLRRSRPAYWGARLLALGPWHTMARHDGPLSVLRAYTLAEIRQLVAQAGLSDARVAARPLFRIIITIRCE